ncbi:MAG: preprotein translocase subunit SecE, partial [Rhodospirillaceae bacterium]
MAKTSPGQFIRQVRQEFGKVTWPSRKEAMISTGMVMIMVFLAA